MIGNTSSEQKAAEDQWWYQDGDGTKGPISSSELDQLFRTQMVNSQTLVWRKDFGKDWQPLGQTPFNPAQSSVEAPPPLPLRKEESPKWRKTFEKFDREQSQFYFSWSFFGFGFGPLYYFYLRMWRKGLVLIGLSMWVSLTSVVLAAMLDLPHPQNLVTLGLNAFCGVFARRDYYRLRRFDERMWPSLIWFRNQWAIVALIVLPVIIAGAIVSYAEDTKASSSSAASSNGTYAATSASPLRKSVISLDEDHYQNAHKLAEQNCAQWLQQTFGGATANQYDEKTVYTYKVDLHGGDINSDAHFFGGHRTMYFNAQLKKYTNGIFTESTDLPGHICIMSDDLEVIGVEDSIEDGFK